MHQCIIQWVEDSVEIVKADSSEYIAAVEAHESKPESMSCISGIVWETNFLKMSDFDIQPIQAVGSEETS